MGSRSTASAPSAQSGRENSSWRSTERTIGSVGAKVEQRPYRAATRRSSCAKDVAFAKFDETVEIAMRLGVDPKHADQMVRGTVVLPHGLGKTVARAGVRLAARRSSEARGGRRRPRRRRGAGQEDRGRLARLRRGGRDPGHDAGRRPPGQGARPPRPDAEPEGRHRDARRRARRSQEIKAGKVEFRVDKTGIIHAPVGKLSFGAEQLEENAEALIGAVLKAKPAAAKGKYVKSAEPLLDHGPGHPARRGDAARGGLTAAGGDDHGPRPRKQRAAARRVRARACQGPHAFLLGYQGITVPQVTELREPGARERRPATWW